MDASRELFTHLNHAAKANEAAGREIRTRRAVERGDLQEEMRRGDAQGARPRHASFCIDSLLSRSLCSVLLSLFLILIVLPRLARVLFTSDPILVLAFCLIAYCLCSSLSMTRSLPSSSFLRAKISLFVFSSPHLWQRLLGQLLQPCARHEFRRVAAWLMYG